MNLPRVAKTTAAKQNADDLRAYDLYPIPRNEITLNPKIEQNPG